MEEEEVLMNSYGAAKGVEARKESGRSKAGKGKKKRKIDGKRIHENKENEDEDKAKAGAPRKTPEKKLHDKHVKRVKPLKLCVGVPMECTSRTQCFAKDFRPIPRQSQELNLQSLVWGF